MLQIGDLVRPKGDHISRSHVGRATAFTTRYNCPTCGTSIPELVRVTWADGRTGDWPADSLEIVTGTADIEVKTP